MQLSCSALAPLYDELSCETGDFSHLGNPHCSPQSALSLSFLFNQPCPHSPPPCLGLSQPALSSLCSMVGCLTAVPFSQPYLQGPPPHCGSLLPPARLTPRVDLIDCLFNSLVVAVPCSLVFWHFWLFIDFRLVVILLLVV